MKVARGPIFLIGFMGAGKTTTGRSLARLLGWDFIDLDEQIEGIEGRGIAEIFERDGEGYFRNAEASALASLRGRGRLIVACGGGSYAREETRALIDAMGRAVWLRLPLQVALARCRSGSSRPLLGSVPEAETLYRSRLSSYRSAPLNVDAEGLSPEQVAERIAALL
ncbi:MAG: shikimate kinase [Acidobacteria bacterium]|nr:shikimate kinase [Acidobacteriota bacterium]